MLLFEVINRGRLGLLSRFNGARTVDSPMAAADFGNGYLMREGYTLVFVGWEFDIRPPMIRVEAPTLDALIEPITVGVVPDAKANEASLSDAPMYEPTNPNDAANTMTVRDHYWDRPVTDRTGEMALRDRPDRGAARGARRRLRAGTAVRRDLQSDGRAGRRSRTGRDS